MLDSLLAQQRSAAEGIMATALSTEVQAVLGHSLQSDLLALAEVSYLAQAAKSACAPGAATPTSQRTVGIVSAKGVTVVQQEPYEQKFLPAHSSLTVSCAAYCAKTK